MDNNLVTQFFDKNKGFEMGIFCTYSLNLEFFENYILNLDGVSGCTNLCVFTDRKVYNSHFDINATEKPKYINRKYLVVPVDTKGVFHPKLYLLASEKLVRIGIGSANITKEGISNNLEIVSIFEISEKDKTYSFLLKQCLEFLYKIAYNTNSKSAVKQVNEFAMYMGHLLSVDKKSPLQIINNLEMPIISKTVELLKERKVYKIFVTSPFYDKNLRVLHYLKGMYPNANINIYIQQGKSNFPKDNFEKLEKLIDIYLFKNEERYIHGKALLFYTDKGAALLTGSANFTDSALLSKEYESNIELCVFGFIEDEISKSICKPNGISPVKVKNAEQLIVQLIDDFVVPQSNIKDDWLTEAVFDNGVLEIWLKNKDGLKPKYVIINGDEKNLKYPYKPTLKLSMKKSEISFIQIEGVDINNNIIYSGNVWVIVIGDKTVGIARKKYYVTNPSQIKDILLDLIQNGTEQDLIDYLLRFNIPLDLLGLGINLNIPKPLPSGGNVIGKLIEQNISIYKNPDVFEAAKQFLNNNLNKLGTHYNATQLNKLDNFMLIYSTIFNMMYVLNQYISNGYKEKILSPEDWVVLRKYYDLMIQCIDVILNMLWNNDDYYSFEYFVNELIQEDNQKILGNVSTFKEFIKQDYEYQYEYSLKVSYKIIKQLNEYIDTYKVKTKTGKLVVPPISTNGFKDVYILKREKTFKLIIELYGDFKSWDKQIKSIS
jgi:HKD family nuclease